MRSCRRSRPGSSTSIFLGGGTPSLFSPAAIGRLLDHARAKLGFAPDIEITLEANPGTIERGKFAEYRAAGVTRVSLGAQSFDARQLKLLGRIHSADETRRAAEELHAAGLANFNLDLMYALPGQTAEEAQADLRAALALDPAHLSQYHLTIEPGHAVRGGAARAARRTRSSTTCSSDAWVTLEAGGLRAVRSLRLRTRRRTLRPQSQLLEVRRLSGHRRGRTRQS